MEACLFVSRVHRIEVPGLRQVAATSKKQLEYFSNTNNSTTLTPPGPQGCLEEPNYPLSSSLVVWFTNIGSEAKLSTEFKFGSLVH